MSGVLGSNVYNSPFFREVGIDPRPEPGFVLAPAQALADEDLADPAAAHGDALFGQIGDQAVQGPRRKRQAQFGWAGQGGGDDGAALLGRVSRRPSGAYILLQPIQSPRVEAVQPVAHRVAAQIHPGGDLLRLQAVHGIDNDLGTADERGSKRVGTCDPLHLHPLMISQLSHSKGHGPAPKPMAMSPQHRSQPAISNDLPDAPLSGGGSAPGPDDYEAWWMRVGRPFAAGPPVPSSPAHSAAAPNRPARTCHRS